MRLTFAILIIIFLHLPATSQLSEKDSLEHLLKDAELDTTRVNTLNRLAYLLHRSNPRLGIKYANESIDLAKNIGFKKGVAHACNSLGACYWNQSEPDSALKYYGKSYEINKELSSMRGTTGALSNMAIIYDERGDYIKAIDTYTLALNVMKNEGLDSYAAITSNNLGLVFLKIGNYPEALKYFREAIKIGEPLGMSNLIGPAWINIGKMYSYANEHELELEAKNKALEIGKRSNDKYIMALAFNNLGNVYRRLMQYDSALSHFMRALEINTEVGRKSSIALNLSNIGVTYREMGLYRESLEQLQMALAIAKEIDHKKRIARTSYQLGQTAKEFSGCTLAIPFLMDGYVIAENDGNLLDFRDLSEILHSCFLEQGDYESALFYHTAYSVAKDSLLNEENIKELAKVEAQYRFEHQIEEKNVEIKLFESKEQLANLKITLLIIGVILVGIVAIFVSRIIILKKERRSRELEAIKKFRESMTSMIAHDLKTPLSVIINSPDGGVANKQMASQMLHLINNMLDVHRFESTDVKLKKKHISLVSILNEARTQVDFLLKEKDLNLEINFSQDCKVDTDKSLLLRVLVNLLTNAIKYSPFDRTITISCKVKDQSVAVSVSDNGAGIPENQQDEIFKSFGQLQPKDSGGIGSTGLGLTFVKLALEALGTEIQLKSKEGEGTTFSFNLPLVVSEEKLELDQEVQEFTTSGKTKEILSKRINSLKEMSLHQIGDIENELSALKGSTEEVDEWIEKILKFVYAGNKVGYEKLLSDLEKD